jgi:hypothetical protein
MTVTQQTFHEQLTEERKSAKTVLGGSLAEGIVAGGVIVLTLLGLSSIMPNIVLAIAVIAMGAAFMIEGGAISVRFSQLLMETSKNRFEKAELGAGVTAEFLGGITGVVLGILSLLGLYPLVLVPVAVIVFGCTLLFGSGVTARLNVIELEGTDESATFKKIAHEAVSAAAGVEFLLGLGAGILGIIALVGTYGITLSLVAMLVIGITGFVNGAAITGRMASIFRR